MKHTKGQVHEKSESELEYLKRRVEQLEKEVQKQNPDYVTPKRVKGDE